MTLVKPFSNIQELFQNLPDIDRKLIALKSICSEYNVRGSERTFIAAVIQTGIVDDAGKAVTASGYQARVRRLHKLGFSEQSFSLSQHHHSPVTGAY
ncbi:MAG: hypothetical protein ACHP65_06975 [Legionellales bacterium]